MYPHFKETSIIKTMVIITQSRDYPGYPGVNIAKTMWKTQGETRDKDLEMVGQWVFHYGSLLKGIASIA